MFSGFCPNNDKNIVWIFDLKSFLINTSFLNSPERDDQCLYRYFPVKQFSYFKFDQRTQKLVFAGGADSLAGLDEKYDKMH